MANEIRRRYNFMSGTIDDNPLSNSATTLNSTELAGLPAISASEYAVLVLDPTGAGNGPEVVYVTAHTGSATSATITRGREGTSGVQHASTITWVHVATASDFALVGDDNDQPSTGGLPYEGQKYIDATNDRIQHHSGSAWVRTGWYSSTGRTGCTVTRSSTGGWSSGAWNLVTWDAETFDSDGFITPSASTVTVPSGLGGLYAITCTMAVETATAYNAMGVSVRLNGTAANTNILTNSWWDGTSGSLNPGAGEIFVTAHGVVPLAAGDVLRFYFYQISSGAQSLSGTAYVYRIGA